MLVKPNVRDYESPAQPSGTAFCHSTFGTGYYPMVHALVLFEPGLVDNLVVRTSATARV